MRRRATAVVVFVLCGVSFFGTVAWVVGQIALGVSGVEVV